MARVQPLVSGDVVRVVAPSGAFDRSSFMRGIAAIEQAGLIARYDERVFERELYVAGSNERRLDELRAALAEPGVRAIWAARGGYGCASIAVDIDVSTISRAARWLIGFSDVTALHALWYRAGVWSVHGPNVTTLSTWGDEARAELFSVLSTPLARTYQGVSTDFVPPRREGDGVSSPHGLATTANTCVQGRIVGGNLTVLASMVGTKLLPRYDDCILLIEDVGERPYRLDRCVTQLRQGGALEGVRAVVVGQLTSCEETAADFGALDAIRHALSGHPVPIVAGFPFGHDASARAVLLGARAELDLRQATLTVHPS